MRPEHRKSLTLAAVAVGLPLLASCADVLGLDEPTVREGAGGGTSASTSSVASTTAASSTTSTGGPGGGGPGNGGGSPGSSGTGGAGGEGGRGGGCNGPADCEDDNPCTSDACDATCSNTPVADGPLIADPEDCRTITCVAGAVSDVANDAEDPGDVNPPCETTICLGGAPSPDFAPEGTPCGPDPQQCDAAGLCIGCDPAPPDDECGADTVCAQPSCVEPGVCDPGFLPPNTTLQDPTAGDCQVPACTGSSAAPISVANDADLPSDTPCGDRGCSAGAPTTTTSSPGQPCIGQIGVCDGVGTLAANCRFCQNTTTNGLDNGCSTATPNCEIGGSNPAQGEFGDACRECVTDTICFLAEVGSDCLGSFVCGCNASADCFLAANGDYCVTAQDRCGCQDDADCVIADRGDECDSGAMLCGCNAAFDCDNSSWGSRCEGGVCGCAQDADCASSGGTCNTTTDRCE